MVVLCVRALFSDFNTHRELGLRNLTLGQHIAVLRRSLKRPRVKDFVRSVSRLGIEQVQMVPGSSWQFPFVERLIGSIRRECLDHMIIAGERQLRLLFSGMMTTVTFGNSSSLSMWIP